MIKKITSHTLITILSLFAFLAPGLITSFAQATTTTFSSNTTEDNKKYATTTSGENTILVTSGIVNLNYPIIEKSGSVDSEEADFKGINAGVLVKEGGTLSITGGSLITNGAHANGAFAYGQDSTLNLSDMTIQTSASYSGGIMVTGGATVTANNCSVSTTGNSSAPIRSDRGGGTMTITGGTYESSGIGSPAIYSTADISVEGATLDASASEGIVVEGANSVSLTNVQLTDNNDQLNGKSDTYKNIFLYQSMSGDAKDGTATFTAKDSTIHTDNGDTFFITNTTATINLENTTFTNRNGDFLRIRAAAWGNSGKNGGHATFNLVNQTIEGNSYIDDISSLTINMEDGSLISGAINTDNKAGKISLTMSSDSVLSLTADTYLSSLENADVTNSNIYGNGQYHLYIDGRKVSISQDVYVPPKSEEETTAASGQDDSNYIIIYVMIAILAIIVITGITAFFIIKNKDDKKPKGPENLGDVPSGVNTAKEAPRTPPATPGTYPTTGLPPVPQPPAEPQDQTRTPFPPSAF